MSGMRMHGRRWGVAIDITITFTLLFPSVARGESWEVLPGCCRTADGSSGDALAEMIYDDRVVHRCKRLCVATPSCVAAEVFGYDRCEVLRGAIVTAEDVGQDCRCFVRGSASPGASATSEPAPPPAIVTHEEPCPAMNRKKRNSN